VSYEKGMTHNDSQTMRAMQTMRAQWCNATWPRKPWHTMTHGHAAKNFEGEGVGPSGKGQQKRSVHEQFFFLVE
jgi:hypothetical protein